jgi:hypothetical protein
MKSSAIPRSLTFGWDQVRRIPLVLGAFILISLALHSAAFFLLQVVYPPQASIKPPHPSFSILDPRRPDHQALLRWIDAEDPAPSGAGGSNIAERLLDIPYRPSFTAMRTQPLALPESVQPVLFPPARDALAIIRSVEAKPEAWSAPPPTHSSRVVFSGELAQRVPERALPFAVNTRVAKPVDVPEFIVGVTDRGEIRYIFPQRSSADPNAMPEVAKLDEEAAEQLSRLKLNPAESPLTWGRARIEWGAEIYEEPPAGAPSSSGKTHP